MSAIASAGQAGLSGSHLVVGYGAGDPVLDDVCMSVALGAFTVIVGANACGKSTLLRTLGRGQRPSAGSVHLDGRSVANLTAKGFARRVAMLPQAGEVPEGITVGDLVARGRYPHKGLLRQWSEEDARAVRSALRCTATEALVDRRVAELSGGQRQRVRLAMALAQDTEIVLLDEPTTYLDLAHQLDLLELCRELTGRSVTVVAVLHDLNQAARYADQIVAVCDGRIVAEGTPVQVVTPAVVEEVFGVVCRVITDPESGCPLVIPCAGRSALASRPQAVA